MMDMFTDLKADIASKIKAVGEVIALQLNQTVHMVLKGQEDLLNGTFAMDHVLLEQINAQAISGFLMLHNQIELKYTSIVSLLLTTGEF